MNSFSRAHPVSATTIMKKVRGTVPMIGVAISVLFATSALAQTPAPDNYAVLMLDKKENGYRDRLTTMDNTNSALFSGTFDIYRLSSVITKTYLPLPKEALPSGALLTLSHGGVTAIQGNLVGGQARRPVPYPGDTQNNDTSAMAWDLTFGTPIPTNLNVLCAPFFGKPSTDLFSRVYDTDGTLLVGGAGVRVINGQFNQLPERAFVWERTANGFVAHDLNQESNLPDTGLHEAWGVSGGSIVGNAAGRAVRWNKNPVTGKYEVTDIHPDFIQGEGNYSSAHRISGNSIVGHGRGISAGIQDGQYLLYYSHAIRWDGNVATDIHQSAGLNSLLGVGGESFALGVRGDVTIGSGEGANFGIYYISPNIGTRYIRHAFRWTSDGSGGATALDLHQFLPNLTEYAGYISSSSSSDLADDGTIFGYYAYLAELKDNFRQARTSDTVIWKPLVATDVDLKVPEGTTGYITKPFIQSQGLVSVHGNLSMNHGANGPVNYTIAGGQMGVYGEVNGSVLLTGGSVLGSGIVKGTVANTGGTVIPGLSKGFQPTPFTIYTYNQGRNGAMGVALRYENTLTFPPRTVLKANSLKTTRATLNGALLIAPPKQTQMAQIPVGSQVVVLTAQNLVGSFTSVTPGWRLTYTGSPLYGQRSVVATYIGTGTPPRL